MNKKKIEEKKKIEFNTNESLYYNEKISMNEMLHALKSCRTTAPGIDLVDFEMLKHLGTLSQEYLLKFYNKLWSENVLPDAWKHAVVVPIQKTGKDPSQPTNYRPISLTSAMCKLLEKIVNLRMF